SVGKTRSCSIGMEVRRPGPSVCPSTAGGERKATKILRRFVELELPVPSARQWTLVATILGSSLTFIDATVVNVALPALQADLHATITDVQRVIEAYALLLGGLILVGGSMGDQFGRKRTFLAGLLLFTTASVACGLAASARALIIAR